MYGVELMALFGNRTRESVVWPAVCALATPTQGRVVVC